MSFYSPTLAKILEKWPGKRFGVYRFLPYFFFLGAGLEFTMIHWDFRGKANFYRTYKRRQVQIAADEALSKTN